MVTLERLLTTSPYARFWRTGEVVIPVDALIAWARAQRLLPLVGWRAKREGWVLPEALREAVQVARYRQAAKQTLVDRQMRSLAALVCETSLNVAVVKGPVVAEAYPMSGLRPYGDLDLFAPEGETLALVRVLERQGYRAAASGDRSTHLPPLVPPGPGFRVEVHGLPYEGFTFAPLQPWARFPGLWFADPLQHFLFLVYHVVERHELRSGLLHLIDLALWTESWSGETWRVVHSRAEARAYLRPVGLALALLPLAWPKADLTAPVGLFPAPPASVLEAGARAVFGHEPGLMPHLGRDLSERSLRGWVRYAGMVLSGGDPRLRRSLPWREQVLFHLRRPFRLLRHYGPFAWRLLWRERGSRASLQRQRDLMAWVRGD